MFASLCMFHVPHFTFAFFLSFPLVWYTVTIQHTDAVLGCETQVKPASRRKESRHKLSSVARGGWRLVMNSGTESATNKASSPNGCTCAGRVGDVAGLCSDWTDANLQRHSGCHVQHTGIVQHIGSRVSTASVVATLYSSWAFLPLSYPSMLNEVALPCTCVNRVSYLQ